MTVTEFLSGQVPFLAGITPEEAHALAEDTAQQTFKPGAVIVRQGITVDALYVIASGKVAVEVKPKGKQAAEVARLGPGSTFGETSILQFGVAGATVKAVEESLIFVIPQNVFLDLMEKRPALKELIEGQIKARVVPKAKPPQ